MSELLENVENNTVTKMSSVVITKFEGQPGNRVVMIHVWLWRECWSSDIMASHPLESQEHLEGISPNSATCSLGG